MPRTLSVPGLTTGHAPFVEEARDRGELYITQAYELYSKENHEAWRRLYERIRPRWERYGNDHFLRGIEALDLPPDVAFAHRFRQVGVLSIEKERIGLGDHLVPLRIGVPPVAGEEGGPDSRRCRWFLTGRLRMVSGGRGHRDPGGRCVQAAVQRSGGRGGRHPGRPGVADEEGGQDTTDDAEPGGDE